MTGWVWVISPANGLPHRLPDDPGVIGWHEKRGYEVTDLPGDLDSDDPDFIELLEARQEEASTEAESAEAEKEDE